MNIEEAKEEIKKISYDTGTFFRNYEVNLNKVLQILDQVDQPKPKVPQFVADWYEKNKNDLYKAIYNLNHRIMTLEKPYDKIYIWYCNNWNAIETLINMHQFGYTIEKEKLYTIEIPDPNERQLSFVLMRQLSGNVSIKVVHSDNLELLKRGNDLQLTEQEIRKDFDWAWQFREEVAE
ncbi:TPA: DUF1642 domain-containing protein [Streptococcus agalactiae]|nr:DUF1642 domain-containing protein [Streptococcus agalactiae]HEM9367783.1 DUF1642 domain-containing protein [Streptococcus agalactiae]HEN3163869.1 DUF1642 domain-containing protein [Streptococcus agalactiae]HEN3176394.1 DUF1642 domain-containing protein [Streptococcus agalactiae]HEN3178661.1 DUF1642 domain-containing protein [Streptococcus agalactiae]